MSRQRPYRQRSPFRETEDLYVASNALRSELSMLEEENAILKLKCIKVSELQQKVQLVLKQNAQLLSENQKMSRILHQQKLDNENLSSRLESTSVQKKAFIGQFEVERKKLLQELERTRDAMVELELKKNNQISEIKNNQQLEIQTLRKQIGQAESSSEHQIRRYREQLDKREQELNDYVCKLKRVTTQTDYQILKLKEDKEKLKAQLAYSQSDHIKELEHLKGKLENNYLEQLQALKRAHVNALDEAERQNTRLREAYQDRGRQLDQLTNKFTKQKQVLDDNISYLKKDNEALRNKIYDTEQMGHFQLNNLRERMTNNHEEEIAQILAKLQGQIKLLEDEIVRLEDLIQQKNAEIEQQLKDKVTNRNMFDAELGRVKDDYAMVLQKYKDQELKLADVSNQSAARLNDREKHIQYLENINKEQKASAQNETVALQKAIEVVRQDLNNERMIAKEAEQSYKEQLAEVKRILEETNYNAQKREKDLLKGIDDLKDELSGTSTHLSNRAEGLTAKNRALEKENEVLKNSLAQKEKEIRNLNERLKASNERQTRLQAQIDDLRNKLIKREQHSNQTIKDQKARLQASYANALESLKSDHLAALRLQANKIRDLQQKLRKKDAQLQQLLKMYKKMTEEVEILTHQEANKKDITLKFPGATADLIASKNLFDVYLKTKVLDVCGDALKQNSSNK